MSHLFLGVRIGCAKCHNHPQERWTQDDYYGLAAFFARVKYRDGPFFVGIYNKEETVWLDRQGGPMTDAAKITERFQRLSYGRMEIEITIDDPKAYTAPWTIKLKHNIVLDTELIDYICTENEKDAGHMVGK